MEPKLLVKRNIGILVAMFRDAPHKPLERLIKPFKDMLTCSPKLCTHFSAQVCLVPSLCCLDAPQSPSGGSCLCNTSGRFCLFDEL